MPGGDVLNLVRVHLEAGHGDHVLLSILEKHEAAIIDATDVASAQPTPRQHDLCGLVGPVPVALHDLRAPYADLAGGIEAEFLAVIVPCGDVGGRNRKSDGTGKNLV